MSAIRILFFVLTIAIAACAGPQRQGGPPEIGRLDVDGPNAFRNGVRADDGARVRDGDTVTTGAGTSVRIIFRDGGYVQLDQNTDPEFRLFREGGCILVRILTGQAFIDAKRVCIADPNIEVALNSRVNIRSGTQSALTVIQGRADVTRPARVTVPQYYQYRVTGGKADAPPYYIGPERAAETANWTRNYFRRTEPGTPVFPPYRPRPVPGTTTPTPGTTAPTPGTQTPTPGTTTPTPGTTTPTPGTTTPTPSTIERSAPILRYPRTVTPPDPVIK